MGKSGAVGIRRVVNAAGYSFAGLGAAWRYESAFRQESVLAVILVPLAFVFGDNATEIALLLMTLIIVLITELLNSAVEATIDRIGLEHHELAGRAKDMGSAAVFLSLCLVIAVWSLVIVS